jgi:hypothetical protein
MSSWDYRYVAPCPAIVTVSYFKSLLCHMLLPE